MKKKLKSLTGFHSASKMNNHTKGAEKEGKKKKIQKILQNKSKHSNNKYFS